MLPVLKDSCVDPLSSLPLAAAHFSFSKCGPGLTSFLLPLCRVSLTGVHTGYDTARVQYSQDLSALLKGLFPHQFVLKRP